jgi:sugar lactone lactonase YvrE
MRTILFCIVANVLSVSSISAQELSSPESIVWDDITKRYLVSNAGDGLLRAVDQDGASSLYGLEAKASHGLLVKGNRLYACYRASIRSYDLRTEALVDVYSISGAKFLNGICADDRDHLYITDFTTKAIYRVSLDSDGDMQSATTWKSLDRIPNGIAFDPDKDEIVTLTWGNDAEIFCIDRATARIKMRETSGYANLEAILVENGNYYVSAWSPAAILSFPNGLSEKAIELPINGVDRPTGLVLDSEGNLLHLQSQTNHIVGLEKALSSAEIGALRMSAFPNPVSTNSLVSYEVKESGDVSISIYDCRGNLVEHLGTSRKESGRHQFFYERSGHPSGLYFIHIQTESESQAMGLTLMD